VVSVATSDAADDTVPLWAGQPTADTAATGPLSLPVANVGAVVDADDVDEVGRVVDSVDNPVGAGW